ncbi:MAG: hypothetical protein K2K03_01720 [Prevotella sp.]|nr:hypothetical protein [Prevotella sp.]
MKAKLFETLVSDIMADPFFSDYKFKKSDNMLYRCDGGSRICIKLPHWRDYGECRIRVLYGRRFEILTRWFEKFSCLTLRDQRSNDNVIHGNTYYGLDDDIYFDYNFSDYDQKVRKFIPMLKENLTRFLKKYSTLEDFYNVDVLPVITNNKELPDVGANWIFIYLTLGFLVDKDNYPTLKKKILERVEWMHGRNEPNVAHYYDRMDEIISYMEENVRL